MDKIKEITKERCMEMILNKFPDFIRNWEKYIDEWQNVSPGFTIDMCEFAEYVVNSIQQEREIELDRVFQLVEYFIISGDEEVKNAVATGFLEYILNATSRRIDPSSFVPFMGESSKNFCREWDKLNGVKTKGL